MRCPRCGSQASDTALFCTNCGSAFDEAAFVAAVVAANNAARQMKPQDNLITTLFKVTGMILRGCPIFEQ